MNEKAKTGERIKIHVNGKALWVSRAFSVRHALLAYDEDSLAEVVSGEAYVTDAKGDEVGLDGALFDGMSLFVRDVEIE
ncbi:MAG: hypothetical protein JSW03_10025 [Candidatus Eiseniibacteriota bacterium]|nr:MAG: hypothetical protein JSW03_10025 [Candidatus Eisenbacteria bacterium]